MNWLAHLHLSGESPGTRIGNLLPDLMNGTEMQGLPAEFTRGVQLHRFIDSYTDSHPVFRQSKARIDGPLRRYGAVLVDLFYDHFLTQNWASYSSVPLEDLVGDFHASIDEFRPLLPEVAYARLAQIRDDGYLLSYDTTEGISTALKRLSHRLRRYIDLSEGVPKLELHYDAFAGDFREFYPQLVGRVQA